MTGVDQMHTAWIFVLIAAAFNMGANVLLKFLGQTGASSPVAVYLSPLFIVACGMFGLNLLAYTQALKTMPMSLAYPMLVGVSAFGLALISVYGFNDTLGPQRILGFVLLVAALYLIGE